ncbi:MAG: nucleotidyltransferase family protein [Chloroflexi bacterium]|nr:nucleotidyltransferase family protein [Chloroflexota bacterium]
MPSSPEARFIAQCVREPDARSAGALERSAAAVQNWPAVAELAAQHGVAGFIRRAAGQAGLGLPPNILQALRAIGVAEIAHRARLDAALARILPELEAAAVLTIVLKGPALARSIYPEPLLRSYSDIDLVVRERDEAAAARVLVAAGFPEVEHGAEVARRAQAGDVHEGCAFHRVFLTTGVMIELHLDPLQMGLRPTREDARWRYTRSIPGLPGALMLGPVDQIVQLSVHVHKHGFSRLIWLKDLDLLVRTYAADMDWQAVRIAARAEGVNGSVWYALTLTRAIFGTPLPPGVLVSLAPSLPVRWLYACVWPAQGVADLRGHMRRRAVQFLAADSWRGMLPNLILMGRRETRLRAMVSAVAGRAAGRRHPGS